MTALDLAQPVGPQLVQAIRRRIIVNDWAPGQRLSETEVAAQYGVSRQPVREAFIKLREEGLIEVRPQRGSFVRKISRASVLDARFVREAIEADIVRIVAATGSDALVDHLGALIAEQRDAAVDRSGAFMEIDDEFHRSLARAAGHIHAWETVEGMKSQLDRVRHLSTQQFPKDLVIGQHEAIVAAIAVQDVVKAESVMRRHLRNIIDDLPAIHARVPDYFEDA